MVPLLVDTSYLLESYMHFILFFPRYCPNSKPAIDMMLLELRYYQGISVYFAVVSVLAFTLNSSVIIIFLRNRSLLLPSNYFLLSLAFSDVLRATLVLPVYAYGNHMYMWLLHDSICQYIAFLSTLLGLTSMAHLVSLALQRWVTLKRVSFQEVSERKMAMFVIGLWLYALAWSLCPLLGWSSFGKEPGYTGCSINWHSSAPADKAFIICLFIFFFFVPVAIAIFCYISIYFVIRKMEANAVQRWGTEAIPTQETVQAKARTVRMSMMMLLAFLVAWTPYAIVSMYATFTSATVSPLISTLPSLFAKLSTFYNPIIYFFMYSKFRKAGKDMILNIFSSVNSISCRRKAVVLPIKKQSQGNENCEQQTQDEENTLENQDTHV